MYMLWSFGLMWVVIGGHLRNAPEVTVEVQEIPSGSEGVAGGGYTYKSIKRIPKSSEQGFAQKFEIPNLGCRSPLAHFEATPSIFAISLSPFCNI